MMMRLCIFLAMCFLCGCGDGYHIKKANYYEQRGDHKKAIEYFDKAIAYNPQNYDVYIDKGIITSELGDNAEAVQIFTKAISISPKEVYAYYCRAESYMRMEDYQNALNDYNSALDIIVKGSNGPIQFIPESNPFFSIVDIDPYAVYADRAVVYIYLDLLEQAWDDLNLCIDQGKELEQCYYWRGYLYYRIGREKEGCEDFFRSANMGYDLAEKYFKEYCSCKEN